MATSSPNFLVQNMEKVALVIALVVLGICVLTTMTGGEPRVSLDNSSVPVSEANDKLLAMVEDKLLKMKKPDELAPVEPWKETAEAAWLVSDSILAAMALTPISPAVVDVIATDVGRRTSTVDQAAEKMPLPEKPYITGGAELVFTDDRDNPVKDQVVIHVVSSFPANELNTAWNEAYKGYLPPTSARFARVEVQRQELDDDGTWSEPKFVKDAAVPPILDSRGDRPRVMTLPEIPNWIVTEDGRTNDVELTAALSVLAATVPSQSQQMTFEERIVQPPYWRLLNNQQTPMDWKFLIRRNLSWMERDVNAAASASTNTPNRSGVPAGGGYPQAYGGGPPPEYWNQPSPSPAARPLVAAGEMVRDDVAQLPPFATQRVAKLMVWIHDEDVKYNKTYRYRIRVSVVNPLLRNVRMVKEDDEVSNRQALVFPKKNDGWSEWSDRKTVERQVDAFLVGVSPGNSTVTMQVFARGLGQRVEQRFSVSIGDKIGEETKRNLADPLKPRETVEKPVDFATGLTLVAIDWNKRLAGDNRTVQITLMDEQGRLQTRILQADTDNPRRKELIDDVNRGPLAIKAAPPPTATQTPKTPVRQPTRQPARPPTGNVGIQGPAPQPGPFRP